VVSPPDQSEHILIRNLTIRNTGGNGDGLDSREHVRIDGCDIATGDEVPAPARPYQLR